MAKIQNVDYMDIPGKAKTMRTQGQALNTEITTAYKSIENMHSNWYGKRYNELVKEFNKMTPSINEMLELVVGEIPFTLETVANNYSQADRGQNATSAQKTSPKKVTNLNTPNDVGMKFITSSVESTQKSVSNNFSKAKNKMNEIESTFGKVKWQSEAADAFKSKFSKLKKQIVTSFEEIEKSFKNLMSQTLSDVQSAETANTVK